MEGTNVGSWSQEEESDDDQENVEDETNPAPKTSCLVKIGAMIGSAHPNISHAPEDESKEGIEQRAHDGKQVREEGDHLRDDPGPNPEGSQDGRPRSPSDNGVVALVASAIKQAEENETRRHGSVEHPQEDDGRNHERECDFLVDFIRQGTKGGCSRVLTRVNIDDGAHNAEDNDLGDGHGGDGLPKVPWFLHLRDEAGQGDLSDERVTDIQERTHTLDERRSLGRDNQPIDPSVRLIAGRMTFDAGEDGRQQHGDKSEEGGKGGHPRQRAECARKRKKEGNNRNDEGEYHSADRTIGHGVEIFSPDDTVQTLNEGIVQEEHDRCGPPCNLGVPEEVLAQIADIADLGMSEAKSPVIACQRACAWNHA